MAPAAGLVSKRSIVPLCRKGPFTGFLNVLVSPTKTNNGVKNFRDKNTTTNFVDDNDDGIYEGFESQPPNVARVRKSESPKKSASNGPDKSSDKFSDKSTQTGVNDDDDDDGSEVDKKKKKNGNCVIL